MMRCTRAGERGAALILGMALVFLVLAGQLVRLASRGASGEMRLARMQVSEPVARIYTRPDVVDRNGRLLATDLEAQSLYADPTLLLDADEAAEAIARLFPDIDATELRRQLADRARRFVWIRRGLTPGLAQRIHDLGLPGLFFRREPKRSYPAGQLAGHVLGAVNVDNKGVAGIERHIDELLGLEAGLGAGSAEKPPVRLTIDLGVQHGLEEELSAAMVRYGATAAAGIVIDAVNGQIAGAASMPDVDPGRPAELLDAERMDRLQVATYELGSIFKAFTVAMALEAGLVTADSMIDVRTSLRAGRFLIKDLHPLGRPLSVRDIFVHSSNVGAAMLAQMAGGERQRAFLARLGLLTGMRTEAGGVTPPKLPERWGEVELVTISYGHGIALAPLQFAGAAAALVNGGSRITPTYLAREAKGAASVERVMAPETSARMRELMRRNVIQPGGTGRRAEVPGYEVGGKTGTAEIAVRGGYEEKAVVASFLAAFPMSQPRYVVLVSLIEPRGSAETRGQITAGVNAAPVAARIIARSAPLLGVLPKPVAAP